MAKEKETPEEGEEAKGGGKKKLIIMIGGAALLAGGGYFFFLKPVDPAAAAEAAKPKKGAVVVSDPIHINLADEHFLKLGIALQATADAKEEPPDAEALDIAIELFSGKEISELQNPKKRHELKEELTKKVVEKYTVDEVKEVMEVYFTEFVVQ